MNPDVAGDLPELCRLASADECTGFHPAPLGAMKRMGGDMLVGRVLQAWLTSTPARVLALSAGLEQGNLDTVRHEAHTLKSSCASIGLMGLSCLAKAIELEARAGQIDHPQTRIAELTQAYAIGRMIIERVATATADKGFDASVPQQLHSMVCTTCHKDPPTE